jgi:hypothetical protein
MALQRDNNPLSYGGALSFTFEQAVRYISPLLLVDLIVSYESSDGGAPSLSAENYALLVAEKARRDAFLQSVEEAHRVVVDAAGKKLRIQEINSTPDIPVMRSYYTHPDDTTGIPRVPVDWEIPT